MAYSFGNIAAERSFRILRLHGSAAYESPIRCDLVERSLDAEEPAYEAISYCWGDQRRTQVIYCNGQRLNVTKNCESALKDFRPTRDGQQHLLWIDAICINQASVPERSSQVGMMGDIYKGARRVLIWLKDQTTPDGDGDVPDSGFHERNFAWLVRLVKAATSRNLNEKEAQLARVAEELNGGNEVNAAAISETHVRLSWFKRLWTVQEAVLGREGTLVYGDQEVSLDAMLDARRILSRLQEQGQHSVAAAAGILWNLFAVHLFGRSLLHSAKSGQILQRNTILLSFIAEVRYSTATDPKDKIVGLYGLLKESGIAVPPPDYEKTTATIYREAMVALTQATGNLEFVKQVDGLGSLDDRVSWVPNWSSSKHSIGPAAGPSSATADSPPVFRFLEESTVLALRGFKFDKIIRRSSCSYMHHNERLGKGAEYANWTMNPGIRDHEWARRLQEEPEYGASILFLWNIRVLQDFVLIALDGNPMVASQQSILALYHSLLSQRGGHDSPDLGLQDPEVGERRGRDFFTVLFGDQGDEDSFEPDNKWILGHAYALKDLENPALHDLLNSDEYTVLQRISRDPVRRLIFDGIGRIRYMTAFTTEAGRTGIAPWSIKSGDELALCSGLGLPVVMRPSGENYNLIACAYVHGLMEGEAWIGNSDSSLHDLIFV